MRNIILRTGIACGQVLTFLGKLRIMTCSCMFKPLCVRKFAMLCIVSPALKRLCRRLLSGNLNASSSTPAESRLLSTSKRRISNHQVGGSHSRHEKGPPYISVHAALQTSSFISTCWSAANYTCDLQVFSWYLSSPIVMSALQCLRLLMAVNMAFTAASKMTHGLCAGKHAHTHRSGCRLSYSCIACCFNVYWMTATALSINACPLQAGETQGSSMSSPEPAGGSASRVCAAVLSVPE